MKKLISFLLCTLIACSYYPEVEYEIKDGGHTLVCKGYDDKFRYESEGYTAVSCTWYCHNYQGHSGAYVVLDFVSVGDGWYLDSTFIDDDGICD